MGNIKKTGRYNRHLNRILEATGTKRIWISAQLGMSRSTFWRKVNSDTLTDEEKQIVLDKIQNRTIPQV
jgi:hypothetical protein